MEMGLGTGGDSGLGAFAEAASEDFEGAGPDAGPDWQGVVRARRKTVQVEMSCVRIFADDAVRGMAHASLIRTDVEAGAGGERIAPEILIAHGASADDAGADVGPSADGGRAGEEGESRNGSANGVIGRVVQHGIGEEAVRILA